MYLVCIKICTSFFEEFENVMNVRMHFCLLCGIIPREHVGIPSVNNIQKCLINAFFGHIVCLKC